MGASPQQKAMQAAKGAVEQAVARQGYLLEQLEKKAGEYKGDALGEIANLESVAGTKLPDYISAVKQQFGNIPTIEATQQKYEKALSGFEPGLLGSASDQRLRQSLTQGAQQYAQGIGDVARGVSGRLYQTLEAPKDVFSDLASSPATNLQLGPMAMMMATKPKTIRSDVGSMKNLYTYNV